MKALHGLVIKHQQPEIQGVKNDKIDISVKADCEYRLNEKFRDYIDVINQVDGYIIVTYNPEGNKIQKCEMYKFPQDLLNLINQQLSSSPVAPPPAIRRTQAGMAARLNIQ